MSEYHDKEIVKEVIGKIVLSCIENPKITCGEIQSLFESIPFADVKPVVRGEWEERIVEDIDHDPYGFFKRRWYCSSCGRWQTHGSTKFCPNCGADMRKRDKSELVSEPYVNLDDLENSK